MNPGEPDDNQMTLPTITMCTAIDILIMCLYYVAAVAAVAAPSDQVTPKVTPKVTPTVTQK
jgi:hypothetical protein